MKILGIICIIVGVVLYVSFKLMLRKNRGFEAEEDWAELMGLTVTVIKAFAAMFVVIGIILITIFR